MTAHTCARGYVWREAFSGDDVCVTSAVRQQVRADNAAAASRVARGASNGPIVINRDVRFGGGVPVGGSTSLTLNSNGTYKWSGHMHDSGATSYNYSGACAIRFSSGAAFVFQTSGRMRGTFESGSRNHDWNKSGTAAGLAAAWSTSQGYKWSCSNSVKLTLAGVVDEALKVVGAVATVVKIIA